MQQLQPQDLAATTGLGFVAHRVHVHVAALVLRNVAGRIGRMQQVVERRAFNRDFDRSARRLCSNKNCLEYSKRRCRGKQARQSGGGNRSIMTP